jgi:hypothetical protein
MPATQDFYLSDITNQEFVPFIKQVRNFCISNMLELYGERGKIKGSVTVHWNGEFCTMWCMSAGHQGLPTVG